MELGKLGTEHVPRTAQAQKLTIRYHLGKPMEKGEEGEETKKWGENETSPRGSRFTPWCGPAGGRRGGETCEILR